MRMTALQYDLWHLCDSNRVRSAVTQANRESMLSLMARQLHDLHYTQLRARDIKGRHVDKLLALWREQRLEDTTIRNRLSVLRWWCRRVGRPSVMPKTNDGYQLAPRPAAAIISKAITLSDDLLAQVDDPYVQMSLRLQAAFGLRREESIKIKVGQADHGTYLDMQGSWCKNGRERQIVLSAREQRTVLEAAKHLVRFKSHSLIPQELQYFQQRNRYDGWARKLGLPPLHGLRHRYAQTRFAMLVGFECPLCGGPTRETMTPAQRQLDREGRQQVSQELGHERLAIVGMYCGL